MSITDQTSKRSNFLTALCFISVLISIGFICGSVFGLRKMDALIEHQMDSFQTLSIQMNVDVKDVPGYSLALMAIESIRGPVVKGIYSLIGLSFLSVIALVLIFKMKKVGFYIFAFANLISCAGMLYTYLFILFPSDFQSYPIYFLYGAIISFLQIVIFAFQLKNLR